MITCIGLIPAEQTVNPNLGLNVLVMAVNNADREVTEEIRIFGESGGGMRELISKSCTLAPNEHAHLYFYIPSLFFSDLFWGEVCEEMTLFAGTFAPQTPGAMVFVEN